MSTGNRAIREGICLEDYEAISYLIFNPPALRDRALIAENLTEKWYEEEGNRLQLMLPDSMKLRVDNAKGRYALFLAREIIDVLKNNALDIDEDQLLLLSSKAWRLFQRSEDVPFAPSERETNQLVANATRTADKRVKRDTICNDVIVKRLVGANYCDKEAIRKLLPKKVPLADRAPLTQHKN